MKGAVGVSPGAMDDDFREENIPEDLSTPETEEGREEVVKKNFWSKVKATAAKVPFVLDAVAMYYCAIDQKTPLWAKGVAFAALAYFISPVDGIPDPIPIAGYTDDAGAIAGAIVALGSNITDEHKDQASVTMKGENYKGK